MNLRALIGAPKHSVRTGEWKRGEIPRSYWPSRRAKSKAYKYGPLYTWRIVSFHALGADCRIRILLNLDKQIFRATFGVTESGETTVLCDYEFHASEPGWHCHARCGDAALINSGTNRFGSVRVPKAGDKHRRTDFMFGKAEMNQLTAFNCAVTFFKVYEDNEQML
jgi:hypothetical protein